MATIFGKSWKREELLQHVGDIRQLADVRLSELSDGPGRGVRIAEFKTGSGFSFTVLIRFSMLREDVRMRRLAVLGEDISMGSLSMLGEDIAVRSLSVLGENGAMGSISMLGEDVDMGRLPVFGEDIAV